MNALNTFKTLSCLSALSNSRFATASRPWVLARTGFTGSGWAAFSYASNEGAMVMIG